MYFLLKLSDSIKCYGHLSKIVAYFRQFLPDLLLIILISPIKATILKKKTNFT